MTDDELLEFAHNFRVGLLGERPSAGMCFAVCAPLAGLLVAHGVACDLVESAHGDNSESEWYEHYWIRLPDGRVLDPTFDQFTGPAVYLGPPTELHA